MRKNDLENVLNISDLESVDFKIAELLGLKFRNEKLIAEQFTVDNFEEYADKISEALCVWYTVSKKYQVPAVLEEARESINKLLELNHAICAYVWELKVLQK